MLIEKFEAKDYGILNVFTRLDVSFYIPIYQRKYNWTSKIEIIELIDDLRNFEKTKEDGSTYYLGNIIVKAQKNRITDKTEKFILIDGQQRLTTMLLFVNYLKYSLKNEINNLSDDELEKNIEALDEILYSTKYLGEERKLKIENENTDQILREIFEYTKYNKISISKEAKESNYYKNFEFIKNELSIKDIGEWNRWLKIIKNIRVAQITLGTNDSEISVFESINSKGLKLNALDLIKNYLFLISEHLKLSEDEKKRIDNIFSNKLEKEFTTKNNEKDEKKINKFFAAFLTKEKLIDPTKDWKTIYRKFKNKFIESFNSEKNFNKLLNNLELTTQNYIELLKEQKDFNNKIHNKNLSFGFLLNTRFELYLSLFLILKEKLKKNEIEIEEVNKIYKLLDLHNLLLSIVGRVNKDNKFIFSYIKYCNRDISYNSLKEFLIKKGIEGNKSGLVSYDDFKSNFKKQNIYKVDSKTTRYILYRIENYLRDNSGEYIDFNYSVEHIFPQNKTNWKDNFDNEEYLNEYIHSIGNLTLVKTKLNNTLSNFKFDEKLKHLNKSSLKLNSNIRDKYSYWNIKEDDNSALVRAKWLFEIVENIWDLSILKEIKQNDEINEINLLINKLNKITIVNALKIVMYKNYPKLLTLKELEKEIHDLYDLITNDENDLFNVEVTFSKDKIATNGWMTERLQRNWIDKKGIDNRFENEVFFKRNNKWGIIEKVYYKLKNI